MTYQLNTDGGARGNPGPAGIGIVIRNERKEKIYEMGVYIGETTNNQAEYTAVLEGLKAAIERKIANLICYLDSELIVKQLNREYKVKNAGLKPLFQKVAELAEKFEHIEFKHVPREKNTDADLLVNKALDKYMYKQG
ncbi:MAG: ribonuclease HI [Patescibacteria group bacterium]|nr:MAG: ribonuclease HI [Patescibacteria group bacterium]